MVSTPDDEEWLWEALVKCCHSCEVLMQLAQPPGFDWNAVHPIHGTPLMAMVDDIVRRGDVTSEVQELVLWCQKQGADPRRVANGAYGKSGGWGDDTDEFPKVPEVLHNRKSAISLVLGLIAILEHISLHEHAGKYQRQLAAAKQLMNIFAQYRTRIESNLVPQGTINMWLGIHSDFEHADVELLVVGEGASGSDGPLWSGIGHGLDNLADRVKAHSVVLRHASPVLKASLASEMQEGKTYIIHVPGATVIALETLLSTIYLGKTPEPLPWMRSCSRNWARGDRAEGNFRGRGSWWPCEITWVYHNGRCDITYDAEHGTIPYYERRVNPICLRVRGSHDHQAEISEHLRMQMMALDIAHRWQIGYAVELLEQSLADELMASDSASWFASSMENPTLLHTFEMLWEAAALKELPILRKACQHVREHGSGSMVIEC